MLCALCIFCFCVLQVCLAPNTSRDTTLQKIQKIAKNSKHGQIHVCCTPLCSSRDFALNGVYIVCFCRAVFAKFVFVCFWCCVRQRGHLPIHLGIFPLKIQNSPLCFSASRPIGELPDLLPHMVFRALSVGVCPRSPFVIVIEILSFSSSPRFPLLKSSQVPL